MIDLTKLRQDAMAATQGEWSVDTTRSDGSYGDGGPDQRTGFDAFVVVDEDGRALCDTLNRDYRATEIHEDADAYEGHFSAWDEPAKRDATHIANLSPSTAIALIEAVEAAKASLERHAHMAAICRTELSPEDAALREALKPFTKE